MNGPRRPRAALRAEAAVDEARSALDRGDAHAALRPLETARKDYLQLADLAGLREVRLIAEEGYTQSAVEDEPAYERLLYASGQNVRFLGRKRAAQAGLTWEDPHPELDQPGRPEIRAERGLTRSDKIGVATVAAIVVPLVLAGAAAYGIFAWIATRPQHAVVTNDRANLVTVGACDRECSATDAVHVLARGASVELEHSWGDNWLIVRDPGSASILGCLHAGHSGVRLHTSAAGGCPD